MYLWTKELIKKVLLKTFFIFALVVILYILIDFSINSARLSDASFLNLYKYYSIQISNYLEIFLPISFLIAMITTLSEMNINKELLALFSAGLSKNRLLVPLYFIAILLSMICLYNNEMVIPKTAKFMHEFQIKFFSSKKKNVKKNVNSIFLKDHTQLIFSKYLSKDKTLEDVFWIKNFNDIWHIERIELSTPVIGHFLDHLTREQNNRLIKADSYVRLEMPELPLTENSLKELLVPLDKKPLSKLLTHTKNEFLDNGSEKNTLASTKLIFSFSFFLIVICLAPYCIIFSRLFSPFFMLSISILLFIFFYIMIRAFSILCINQVLSCLLALWVPCILLLLLGFYGYFRKNT